MFEIGDYVQHKTRPDIFGQVTAYSNKRLALNGDKLVYNPNNFRPNQVFSDKRSMSLTSMSTQGSASSDRKSVLINPGYQSVSANSYTQYSHITPYDGKNQPNKKIADSHCLHKFRPVMFKSSDSSSDTDIWVFEDDVQNKIFLKIHEADEDKQPGLFYEPRVYQRVTEKCKSPEFQEYQPNFVQFVCYLKNLTYNNLWSLIKDTLPDNKFQSHLVRNLKYIICQNSNRPALDDDDKSSPLNCNLDSKQVKYNILVTKAPVKNLNCVRTLHHFINYDKDHSEQDEKSVLTRVGFAINAQHHMGISHNDQHWHNILVMEGKETKYTYKLDNGDTVSFSSRYCPVLFDWDRAQMKEITQDNDINQLLKRMPNTYQGPYFQPGRDVMFFASQLYGMKWITTEQALLDTFFEGNGEAEDIDSDSEQFCTIIKNLAWDWDWNKSAYGIESLRPSLLLMRTHKLWKAMRYQ